LLNLNPQGEQGRIAAIPSVHSKYLVQSVGYGKSSFIPAMHRGAEQSTGASVVVGAFSATQLMQSASATGTHSKMVGLNKVPVEQVTRTGELLLRH
jgi:hypothetical protein